MLLPFEIWVKISSYLTIYEDIIKFEYLSHLHREASKIGVIHLTADEYYRFNRGYSKITVHNDKINSSGVIDYNLYRKGLEYCDIKVSYTDKYGENVMVPSYRWILSHRNLIRVDYPFVIYRLSDDNVDSSNYHTNSVQYKNNYYDLGMIFNNVPNLTMANFYFYSSSDLYGPLESLYFYNNNSFNLKFIIFIDRNREKYVLEFNDHILNIYYNYFYSDYNDLLRDILYKKSDSDNIFEVFTLHNLVQSILSKTYIKRLYLKIDNPNDELVSRECVKVKYISEGLKHTDVFIL